VANGLEVDQPGQALDVARLRRRPDGEKAHRRRRKKGRDRRHERQNHQIAEQPFHVASPTLGPIMHGPPEDATKSPAGRIRRGCLSLSLLVSYRASLCLRTAVVLPRFARLEDARCPAALTA